MDFDVYRDRYNLKAHLPQHDRASGYGCTMCDRVVKSEKVAKKHMTLKHGIVDPQPKQFWDANSSSASNKVRFYFRQ